MNKDKNAPTFMVVGAAKSGTTSIFRYLNQHPEVFVPLVKESFFPISSIYKNRGTDDPCGERKIIFNPEEFKNQFIIHNKKAIGEVGTFYLYYHEISIPQIQLFLGDVKIIAILRNPVERAYSAYNHLVRDYFETLSFEKSLEKENIRREKNWDAMWYFKDLGFYFKQVKAFQSNFTNVRVYLYDQLKKDPQALMREIYDYLDVDPSFKPNTNVKYNSSGKYRSKNFYRLVQKPNIFKSIIRPFIRVCLNEEERKELSRKILDLNLRKRPPMNPTTEARLRKEFYDDISRLQDLIGRDLSHWLNGTYDL